MAGFPDIPWPTILSKLDLAFESQGTPTEFLLLDSGSITISAIRGHTRNDPLTDGTGQTGFRLRVRASEWDEKSPDRPPGQGDQMVSWGRRHAIESSHLVGVADQKLVYVIAVKG